MEEYKLQPIAKESNHLLSDIKNFIKIDSNASFIAGVLPVPFPGRLYHRLKELKYCYNFKDLDRNKHTKECSPQY